MSPTELGQDELPRKGQTHARLQAISAEKPDRTYDPNSVSAQKSHYTVKAVKTRIESKFTYSSKLQQRSKLSVKLLTNLPS